jgi:heme/copper-type cytochrome/quinol oxidase subunit 1
MPTLTRWFIKSAFIFFVAAMAVRVLQTAGVLANLPAYINALGPIYFHMFLVGWVTQLIFGVVFWMFPKYTQEQPRGSDWLGWFAFWLLNIGLGLRVVAEPMNTLNPDTGWGWFLAISALLQWLAGLGFVINTWSRVKAK